MKQISETQARKIYGILVKTCGVYGGDVDTFAYHQADGCTEYRICGALGFGGKFWNSPGHSYVTCYPEDETPERLEMMHQANEQIVALLGEP